jgi:DNA-binding CsgD family transcriptional regulator
MIVYLWQAGTAEGVAGTSWRARRRAADSMRRLQEQAARIEQAHFVFGTESLHAGYHRAPGDPYWTGRQYPSGRVNWQPGERAPEPAMPAPGQPQDERGLSRRQREVAELVAIGLDNPQIAERLGISRHTVMTHLTVVYEKTGTGGGGQAARERLAAWLQQDRQPPAQKDQGTVMLTPRQLEAARLFAAGVPREEAAARLKIATQVLDARLRAVRAKTRTGGGEGARDRLAGWLADHGLPGGPPADELAHVNPATTDRTGIDE